MADINKENLNTEDMDKITGAEEPETEAAEETAEEVSEAAEEIAEETAAEATEADGGIAEETAEEATEAAEETAEEATEEITEAVEETAATAAAEMAEAAKDASESAEVTAAKEMKASTAAKRAKKAEMRDAKAARKAANKIEEKKSRPNNLLLAILIFGVLIGMFAFVKGYTYYKLEPSIQSYIKNNGGKDTYGSMMIDQHSTASITAKKNDMKIAITCTPDSDEEVKEYTDYYKGEDGEDSMKYIGAYMLTTMKPQTRAFKASVTVTAKVNDEKVNSVKMAYKEAKKYLEDLEKEAQEESEEESGESSEDAAAEDAATENAE